MTCAAKLAALHDATRWGAWPEPKIDDPEVARRVSELSRLFGRAYTIRIIGLSTEFEAEFTQLRSQMRPAVRALLGAVCIACQARGGPCSERPM